MSKFSVKKPFTIFVAVFFVLILGVVSFTRMSTDLLPDISLPYVVVLTTYPGASPDKVGSTVTEPLESGLGTVTGVENVTSRSAENYSMVMLEFEEDTNMDSAMVKLSSALDLIPLPDDAGKPMVLALSMNMVPVLYASVDMEGMDLYELSDFVEETVVPQLERQDGVASVDTIGLLEKTVEIRLDQKKIDTFNDKLAASVNEKLADAKKEIDDAQKELDNAKKELDNAAEELDSSKTSTAGQLGSASALMAQAAATQAAYSAQLMSLQASKTALQTEKQAYLDAGVLDAYNQINEQLEMLSSYETYLPTDLSDLTNLIPSAGGEDSAGGAAPAGEGEETSSDSKETDSPEADAEPAGDGTETDPSGEEPAVPSIQDLISQIVVPFYTFPQNIPDAVEHPEKLTALTDYLASVGQAEAAAAFSYDTLVQLNNAVNTRLPQIDTELANLETEIAAAQVVLDTVNAQVQDALNQYPTLESGKIIAAAELGSASAQLESGKATIESSQAQLDEALKSYENGRDTALANANLDALLNMETLSSLIYAQNFAMPAGYIYENDDQYLLKVGDEFADASELENALLADIDGIGEIHLNDVATVTWIDNAGDQYAKVNGRDGVVISVSKVSTAAAAEVSKTCNDTIAQLEAQYDGLQIVNLMDQGDYIDIIVGSVLQNLMIGAILAMIVLAIFLRSVLPTLVVAFSIPLSVLTAVVLMYFSGISLNLLSLSGLALSIGMLVDNSIVVIENIYRLRGMGVSAAKAAVSGAKQVAGAIAASTLTTICVFFPIVFTTGLVRELFVDLALTMTYALLASLLIALTVVPAMSSAMLRNKQPKEQAMMKALYNGYEKVLRFFLRVKIIPIAAAVVLFILCAAQALNTGMILFPDMGGEQMSATMNFPEELSDEEVFEKADRAMAQMTQIPGVEYVGILSGSSNVGSVSAASLVSGSGGTHQLQIFILLDEETGKNNTAVARRLEDICTELEPEEYSVATSNMDISSYMETGLSVNIYGSDTDTLLSVSEDVMALVREVDGFTNISNGQEAADTTIELTIDKDQAIRYGLTVAQVLQELSANLTTDQKATMLTFDGKQYEVHLVDDEKAVDLADLMDYEFEVAVTDSDGETQTEIHTLSEFASMKKGMSLATIQRENQRNYITVSAQAEEGFNTTLLTRTLEEKLRDYPAPDGVSIEIGGETQEIMNALKDIVLMIILAILFIYLIMVAQFQSLLSPFIVIFTIPLAFTGGFIGLFIAGEEISLTAMIGFLMLTGIVVNNGIVFVDYTNQLRMHGMEKRDALVKTGRNRMRPILMTMLTTVLSMSVMVFSTDAASAMSRGMAIVVIGGLLYATFMTLFIIPVLYDILFRKEPKVIDVGTDEELNSLPEDVY